MADPNRIILKQSDGGRDEEGYAGGTVKPGYLLGRNAAGRYIAHAIQGGGWAERAIAREDAFQGRTIDVNYTTGELIQIRLCAPGDVAYMWLSAGEVVGLEDYLTSNGDGTLKVANSDDVPIGVLEPENITDEESEDTTDSEIADVRIRVRLL